MIRPAISPALVLLATLLPLPASTPAAEPARGGGPASQTAPAGPAEPPGRAAAKQDAGQIRAEIEGLHRALERFFSDHKIEPVMRYYENLIEYFSPSGQREGPDQIRRRLRGHAERVKGFRTQVSPMTIRVSGDIGWAACEVHEAYTFDGQSGEEDLMSTYILERKPTGWRIVHEHQSLNLEGEEDAAPAP